MPVTTVAQLPFEQTDVLGLAPDLRALRRRGAVHRVRTPDGAEAWLVTGHAQVRRLLDDDRCGRSHPDPEIAAKDKGSALLAALLGDLAADHPRLRAVLEPHFSPARMLALRPRVEDLVGRLLDELAGQEPPVDLCRVAAALPVRVMCEWLGVPPEDEDRFGGWIRDAARVADPVRSREGLGELLGYCRVLVADKRRAPGDDVVSRIAATEGIDGDEAVGLTALLLFGGYETTVARIGTCVLTLLSDPERWRALVADPGLVPEAVEETLRLSMPNPHLGGMPRYALTDFEIDGAAVRAGDLLLLNVIAANRDEAAFADADRVDLTRDTTGSLAFGYGAHHCVGAALARMQLQAVLTGLLARLPTLRLAVGAEELRLRDDTLVGGLAGLPVTW